MSSFLIKTCLKFHKCSRLTTIWYTWNYPSWGGGRPGPLPEKLKFQIWPLSLSDKCNLILWWKLSFLWKSEPDPTHLRGVLSWFSCWWYPRYMHSQYMYFELGMYFLMNTLLISLLVVPTLAKNMVYSLTSALLVKIWANLKAPPRRRITGLLGPLYLTSNHCYTGCNSKTYAVRFSRLLTIFLPNFRIIDQHLLLSWADLHVFYTILTAIFGLNNFCSDM